MENQAAFNPNAFREAIKAMEEQHQKVKNLLQTNMKELDRAITEKSLDLSKTTRSVTVDEATAMLMERLRVSVETEIALAEKEILKGRNLRSHTSYMAPSGYNGNGEMLFDDVSKSPPRLLSYDASAAELIALCPEFFFTAIEAHIRKTLLEDGAPQLGPSIAELLDKVDQQVGEIKAMEQERVRVSDEFRLSTDASLPAALREIAERDHSVKPFSVAVPSMRRWDANGQELPGMVRTLPLPQPQPVLADKSAIERELDAIDAAAQEDIEQRRR